MHVPYRVHMAPRSRLELHGVLGLQAVEGLGCSEHEWWMGQGVFEGPGPLCGPCLTRMGCKGPGCMEHAGSRQICGAVSVSGVGLCGAEDSETLRIQTAQSLRVTMPQAHKAWYLWDPTSWTHPTLGTLGGSANGGSWHASMAGRCLGLWRGTGDGDMQLSVGVSRAMWHGVDDGAGHPSWHCWPVGTRVQGIGAWRQ